MSSAVFVALDAVVQHGPLAQKDIGARLSRTSGNVSVIVDELERSGMIERIRDTIDRRLVYARATPRGIKTHASAVQLLASCIEEVAHSLSSEEKNLLMAACKYICTCPAASAAGHEGREFSSD
jgi:MarR family 2-MHQ and catechol resistance regulon transcriptional repressor